MAMGQLIAAYRIARQYLQENPREEDAIDYLAKTQEALIGSLNNSARKRLERASKALEEGTYSVVLENCTEIEEGIYGPVEKEFEDVLLNIEETEHIRSEAQRLRYQAERVQGLLNHGRMALHSGRYEEAVEAFESVRQLQPQSPEIQTLLERARHSAEQEHRLHWALDRGQALFAAESYAQAAEVLTEALTVASGTDREHVIHTLLRAARAGIRLVAGRERMAAGEYEIAESDFMEAVRLGQDCEPAREIADEAQVLLSRIHERMRELRDREEAHKYIQQGRQALTEGQVGPAIVLLERVRQILDRYVSDSEREVYNG